MATTQKNTTRKVSKKRRATKIIVKSYPDTEDTLFPEKLARANELLSKARLLPR